MQIFWPICLSLFSVWMVTLSCTVHLLCSSSLFDALRRPNGIAPGAPCSLNCKHEQAKAQSVNGGLLSTAADGDVVMRSLSHLSDHRDEVFEIFLGFDEVDVRGVDHQQRRLVVVEEVLVVRLDHLFEVRRGDFPLEFSAPPPDARE